MSTISNKTITQTVTLGSVNSYPTYASPLTITSTGTIEATGDAVYGPITVAWTVENQGTIEATGNLSTGIDLKLGGGVDNAGLIEAYSFGVAIYGAAGTVTNSGTIQGTGLGSNGIHLKLGGSVGNTGLIAGDDGVYITGATGTVTNSGTIEGTGDIGDPLFGGGDGIDLLNVGGSVDNTGLIEGDRDGVLFSLSLGNTPGAGTVTNSGTIQGTGDIGVRSRGGGSVGNAGLIVGYYSGVDMRAGTITNSGTIKATGTGTSSSGVATESGGVANGQAGYILGSTGVYALSGAVDNSGTIKGTGTTTGSFGVKMVGGGQLANTGQVAGYVGVGITGAASTVANFGTIVGTTGFGVQFLLGGSLGNSGLIEGGVGVAGADGTVTNSATIVETGTGVGSGVALFAGGSVSNTGTGYIAGYTGVLNNGTGTLANSGTIKGTGTGTSSYGVALFAGGSVRNTGTGSIAGQSGIEITGGIGSIDNFGTIKGIGTATGSFGVEMKAGGDVENSGSIAGRTSVYIAGGTGTVVNVSEINAAGTSTGSFGVELKAGGYVENADIITGFTGIYITGAAGTVNSFGTVTATTGKYSVGVELGKGGSVDNSGGLIEGSSGVLIKGGFGSLTNSSTILGTGTAFSSVGVALLAGGGVSNDSYGLIEARTGVESAGVGNIGTVTNSGTIFGTDLEGVILTGGSVANNAGLIQGYDGVYIDGAPGTVTNSATIRAMGSHGIGVHLAPASSTYTDSVLNNATGYIVGNTGVAITGDPGTVTNYGTIRGTAGTGVNLASGGTVIDAGTIIGGNGTDISFGGTGGNLLVLQSGYYSYGLVVGGTSATNTVQLSASAGALVTAYYGYSGFGLTNFQDVQFRAGGHDTLRVGQTTGTLGATISSFSVVGDIINLASLAGGTIIGGTPNGLDQLVVSNGAQSVTFQLDSSDGTQFTTSPNGSGTDITPACFGRGTRILTEHGEIAVEDLIIGEHVITHSGAAKPIKWIGVGKVLATRGQRSAATPVIVRKGALGPNVPIQDLSVTKGHALYIDGVLIPVEELINHRSILWDDRAQEVQIYHIELETHDVLIANGAPAESYRDDGNRWLFRNANSGWHLPPQEPCAPLLTSGPVVDAIWRRLLDRAGPRPGVPLTDDPDLHLLVDGDRVEAASRLGACIFRLPPRQSSVRIVSRAGIPAELGLARDPRVLGVAVQRIALRQGTTFRVIEAADALLEEGFHVFEPDNGLRWTDGDACVPPVLFDGFDGPTELVLHVGCTTQYVLFGEADTCAAA